MAHTSQDRYSALVLAKLKKELVLKDGVVFNNDYEGSPSAGAVKIPVRDTDPTVGDYNTASGLAITEGATTYLSVPITKDKAVNEVIDGYKAASVPDGITAERLDAAGYALASTLDNDGASTLLAGATAQNETTIDATNAYSKIVATRTAMSKANVPNDGKRYLLVTPDFMSLLLTSDEFIPASSLGDEVKQTGAIGRIAGFNVFEWNDNTANLQYIAGHPKFATRINEWKVPISINDLNNTFIGASAVQGRMVYDHAVLRATAIRACYAPGTLGVALAAGSTTGTTIATITGNAGTLKYKLNPTTRATFDLATATYGGTALTSGTTEIAVVAGDVIEVVDIVSTKVAKVGYITVAAADIK